MPGDERAAISAGAEGKAVGIRHRFRSKPGVKEMWRELSRSGRGLAEAAEMGPTGMPFAVYRVAWFGKRHE